MFKFICTIKKESLILLRDKAGLIIVFLMPMVLIIIMSLLQEVGYSSINRETQVDVLFLDQDNDSLGIKISQGLPRRTVNYEARVAGAGAPDETMTSDARSSLVPSR